MSKQNQTEWRCPYCDGLNDWQDEICQICGDGKRDETVSSKKTGTASSDAAQQPKMQYQAQNQNTYSQQPTKKNPEPERKYTPPEPKIRKPEPEIRRTESKAPKPAPEAPAKKPKKKKHKALRIIGGTVLAAVALAGGLFIFSIQKADKLVENLDYELLEEAPSSSVDEFKSWAESKGYEVTSGKGLKSFVSEYKVNSSKSDWDITVSEDDHGIKIECKADGQNVFGAYNKLKDTLQDRDWGNADPSPNEPAFEEGITGKEYMSREYWCDKNDNWYELVVNDREIILTREDEPVDAQEMMSELNLDFIQSVPEDLNMETAEKWLDKNSYSYYIMPTEYTETYDIQLPESPDWNISLRGMKNAAGSSVVYNVMRKDCKDLSTLYESLCTKMESTGFKVVCQEAENPDEPGRKLTIWQDQAGNLYDLSVNVFYIPYRCEINLVKENCQKVRSYGEHYDFTDQKNQLNIAALAKMPMDSYKNDENWEQKFKENYGDSYYQPSDLYQLTYSCYANFRYYPSSMKDKKEILMYLKNQIQGATGGKMKLYYTQKSQHDFEYKYYADTEHGRITLGSEDSAECVTVSVESKDD